MLQATVGAASAQESTTRWRALNAALRHEPLPAALLDLDAFAHNAALLLARAASARRPDGAPVTLRLAVKSLRALAPLQAMLGDLGEGQVRGLMTYSARSTLLCADAGFDDLLCGYPAARADEAAIFAALAGRGLRTMAMVDSADHVGLLASAARAAGVTVSLCLDVDGSLRLGGGRFHVGVQRSPVRDVEAGCAVAAAVEAEAAVDAAAGRPPAVALRGLMLYEAQVAGLPDHVADEGPLQGLLLRAARRALKARSRTLAAARRRAVTEALRARGHAIELVNGGGSGSVDSSAHDGSCTEVTIGSGLFAPHLFDGYDGLSLRPALLLAVAVCRLPGPGIYTCAGGGVIASGASGSSRQPRVYLPPGLLPLSLEGFGEVQTPLRATAEAPALCLGDAVLLRPAKSGEPLERFDSLLLLRGDVVVGRSPTLRALGSCGL